MLATKNPRHGLAVLLTPSCGSHHVRHKRHHSSVILPPVVHAFECEGCDYKTPYFDTEQEARDEWNEDARFHKSAKTPATA